jgi:hypothetical protein
MKLSGGRQSTGLARLQRPTTASTTHFELPRFRPARLGGSSISLQRCHVRSEYARGFGNLSGNLIQ